MQAVKRKEMNLQKSIIIWLLLPAVSGVLVPSVRVVSKAEL